MRRLTDKLFACALLFCAAGSVADGRPLTLDIVIAKLAQPQVIRGTFVQTQRIPVLENPLVSNGDFILSERGLFWRQLSDPAAIVIVDADTGQISEGNSNPMVLPFSRIFLGIFKGDEEQLRKHFSIEFAAVGERWTMTLAPVREPMSRAIAAIVLRGQDHIEELAVVWHAGHRQDIEFADIRTDPHCLEEHEIELYER